MVEEHESQPQRWAVKAAAVALVCFCVGATSQDRKRLSRDEMVSVRGGATETIGNAKCEWIHSCVAPDIVCSSYSALDCDGSLEERKVPAANRKKCGTSGGSAGDVCEQTKEEIDENLNSNYLVCREFYDCEYDWDIGQCILSSFHQSMPEAPPECTTNP